MVTEVRAAADEGRIWLIQEQLGGMPSMQEVLWASVREAVGRVFPSREVGYMQALRGDSGWYLETSRSEKNNFVLAFSEREEWMPRSWMDVAAVVEAFDEGRMWVEADGRGCESDYQGGG